MKTVRFIVLLLATLSFATPAVRAFMLDWDTNTAFLGPQGGTGNWLGTSFWYFSGRNIAWSDGSDASFGPSAGTVTVNGAVTANSLSFSTSGYTIDGKLTLTLSGSDTIDVANSGDTATISAPIGGTAGFSKSGPGTLNFSSGAANIYSGTATVADGTMNLNKNAGVNAITGNLNIGDGTGATSSAIVIQGTNNQIADTAAVTVKSDGFWNLASANRSETIGSLTINGGTVSSGSGVLTLNGNVYFINNSAAGSSISGLLDLGGATRSFTVGTPITEVSATISNGGLSKLGGGTLILSGTGANTYTGTTTASDGSLVLNKPAGVNAIGGNLVISGAGRVTEMADEQIPDGASVTISGFVSDLGRWDLSNHSETIASLTMTGGTIDTFSSGVLTLNGNVTATSASITPGPAPIAAYIGMSVDLGGATRVFDVALGPESSFDLRVAGAISNGGLTKTGTGRMSLTGTNTFTGPLEIDGGSITVTFVRNSGVASALGAGSSISFDNANLNVTGGSNSATDRAVTLNAGGGTISVTSSGATVTMSGMISGAGGLTKNGPGTLELGGTSANTYAGTTTFTDGTLKLSKSAAMNAIGGNLALGDGTGTASSAIVTQGADEQISDSATVTIAADGFWNLASGNHSETIAALTMSAGSVATGSGTLTVNGNIATNANAASASISDQLNLGGTTRTLDIADGAAATDLDISAWISNSTGGLTKTGAGTLQLSGANTFSGPLAVNAGTLVADRGSAIGDSSDVTIASGATLSIDGNETIGSLAGAGAMELATGNTLTIAGSGSTIFTGSIGGAAGLTRSGSGTLTLTAQPSYTGNTLISGGTLALNSGIASATGNITVNAPGTLQARSTVNRAISGNGTITATGTLIIGDATSTSGFAFNGTLNVGSNVVLLADADSAQLGASTNLSNLGRLDAPNGAALASGRTISASASAAISGALINNGTVNGPALSGQSLTLLGDVNGTGNYTGNVYFSARFSPGLGAGTVSLEHFTFDSAATLALELGGTAAGSQYDQLIVTGVGVPGGTLSISLINGFNPQSGNAFTLIRGGVLSGTFNTIQLPVLAGGLEWNTSQLYTTGVLSVLLPGDFNGNGIVDAADYVVWRKGLGTTYTQNDYDVWRSNFGKTTGSGTEANTNAAVPEPTNLVLLIGVLVMSSRCRAATS